MVRDERKVLFRLEMGRKREGKGGERGGMECDKWARYMIH